MKREREQFTVEERAKLLHDTIAAQRRFLAEQRAIAIRNRPPTRTQLRNHMMTYLKHVGNKKHSELKKKEIQALYEKVKRFDESFTVVGSTEDERKIKEMNEGAKDLKQKGLKKKVAKETPKKEDTTQVLAMVDVTEQGTKKRKGGHIKMIARKRKRPQSDVDSNDEHRECLKIVTFEGTIDSDIMENKSFIAIMNKVSSPDEDYLIIYRVNGNFRAFNYLLEIMMESSTEENDQSDFWNDQQDWEIVTWRLYEACRVYILELKDGTIIHMLVERRYHLSKDLLQRMLDLGLEVERESIAALDLIRFIKQQIGEGHKNWLVHKQTTCGKDYSNLLIADSLLKTIWFINAPCYGNEALASPKANGIDFLPSPECDLVFYEDFSEAVTLSSTNNEDKVFNPGILIHENLYEVTNLATMEKNVKKTTNASLILEDFNPPPYELPFHKEVPGLGALLSFSSENEEKVFNPGILTSKRVHTSILPELSHRDSKAFKVIKIFETRWIFFFALMERTSEFWMFRVSISIPLDKLKYRGIMSS
ncbi:hypothetical protein Tco_0411882 [Tanacetum coccineum]